MIWLAFLPASVLLFTHVIFSSPLPTPTSTSDLPTQVDAPKFSAELASEIAMGTVSNFDLSQKHRPSTIMCTRIQDAGLHDPEPTLLNWIRISGEKKTFLTDKFAGHSSSFRLGKRDGLPAQDERGRDRSRIISLLAILL
ncbi:hypothetical protein K505DRAFT_330344 [Melanomma pulvis-pyrius CBS 109.77]|uniref:Uncharacterized protein n=1 Tax=Melanomma pulvis-pyrius CBS 109.77 TaxID=1314802 RepID=A0A6A6WRA4_9PLEO|nr:hypothetical protein K505DRAFT_330344 [Melanomma pulvis-pyrius CBS 109.77]